MIAIAKHKSLISVHDPQTAPWVQDHSQEARLMTSHQVFGTASCSRRSSTTGNVPVRIIGRQLVRSWPRLVAAVRASIISAVAAVCLTLVTVHLGGGTSGANVSRVIRQMLSLGHEHVVLVNSELLAVQPHAEAQISCQNGEKSSDDASNDGSNVGTATR